MPTRRALLLQAAMFSALPALAFAQTRGGFNLPLDPTPACADLPAAATPAAEEGPYYRPAAPRRSQLREDGMAGPVLRVGGLVLTRDCRPVGGARVELWQADAEGHYDLQGPRLRGYQITDTGGRWQFETVRPGLYPGRTRHLHVKLQPAGGALLTTQLYFPGEARNAGDRLFDKRLLLMVGGDAETMIARYDFVLDIA
jgi:protocatechuate 3,4-dioxygenase beta subunit